MNRANQWPRVRRVIVTETGMDSNYSIFVVDDIEAGRRMIEATFKDLYAVESFPSGQDCLDRLAGILNATAEANAPGREAQSVASPKPGAAVELF